MPVIFGARCSISSSSGFFILTLSSMRQTVGAGGRSEGMMSTLFLHSWVSAPAPFDLVLYQLGMGRMAVGSHA